MFQIQFNWPNMKKRGRPQKATPKQPKVLPKALVSFDENKIRRGRPRKYFLTDNTNIGRMLKVFHDMREPLSDYDLEILLDDHMDANSIRPCRLSLQRLGKIQPYGEKIHQEKSRAYRTYILKGL